MALWTALTTAVLPIITVAGAGYLVGRHWEIDVDSLNTITLQVLLPALAFHSLGTSSLGGIATGRIVGGVVAFVGLMIIIAEGVGRVTKTSEPFLSALVLVSVFPNSGNFGIPLSEFAFGSIGRTTAVLFVTVQNVLVYTVGAYLASRSQGQVGLAAVTEVAKLPLVYAAIAALILRWADMIPPAGSVIMTTLQLVGNASIPLMLIILGAQLVEIDTGAVSRVTIPSVLKLGVAPCVGFVIVLLFGFKDLIVARVFILLCATPAAILPLVLTLTYSGSASTDELTVPEYVGTAIFVTTVASIAVLTVLIVLLRSGILV